MAAFINISDRKEFNRRLDSLDPDTPPLWGMMNAQEMVEHLVDAVQFTNGKKIPTLDISPEIAAREKQLKVNQEFEIPKGARGFLEPATKRKLYKDLPTSILQLNKELDDFEEYFKEEGRTAIHGGFGPMNYQEWVLWHGKHFAHHFTQFGLLK